MSAEKAEKIAIVKKIDKPKLVSVRSKKKFLGIHVSEQNQKYLDHYRDKTGNSYAVLVGMVMDAGRATDLLKDAPTREPAYVKKAREALQNWESGKVKSAIKAKRAGKSK